MEGTSSLDRQHDDLLKLVVQLQKQHAKQEKLVARQAKLIEGTNVRELTCNVRN